MLLNNYWVNEEIKEKKNPKQTWRQVKMKKMTYQNLWDAAKVVLRGKFIANTGLPQKTRKISNKQPNLPPKRSRKNKQTKPKVSTRKKKVRIIHLVYDHSLIMNYQQQVTSLNSCSRTSNGAFHPVLVMIQMELMVNI